MPTLKLQRALREAAPGEQLVLLADDPLARVDVPHYCAEAGVELLSATPDGAAWAFTVRKPG